MACPTQSSTSQDAMEFAPIGCSTDTQVDDKKVITDLPSLSTSVDLPVDQYPTRELVTVLPEIFAEQNFHG